MITLENILVADPGDLGSVKIVDFGLSAQMETGSSSNVKTQCGTLLYMAPEILHQPSYSKAVDIWSCAVIMYILYTGKHPIFV
jgi:serine/threonine protein kinase